MTSKPLRVGVFSSKVYDRQYLTAANQGRHELLFLDTRLQADTLPLVKDIDTVCVFVNDRLDSTVIEGLKAHQVGHIALRCAGFNNVDLDAAKAAGISVSRIPAYSPEAVAEHTLALILTLNRRLHKAYNRVKEGNFSLDGLLGFNVHGKTIGIIGTGKIGMAFCRLLQGFGCRVLCHDIQEQADIGAIGAQYVDLDRLFAEADIISLHCPLTPDTHYLINDQRIAQMKQGVMLINTSRGAMIDSQAVIRGLKSGKIGYLGLDVYEMEGDLFFRDLSNEIIQDDVFLRLATFPNVLITGHQGFFTHEALTQIANVTLNNLDAFAKGKSDPNTFLISQ
ncbi:2-hydroxyacid dehydrogenase [Aliiglaciecola sp. CAU 1673]|uniref:2-hydroxyacid dehydrogenase n=1 Tax=Aliiglaciecola sp. CAU 1673 TaxID=3032595 RepID=UPI0023DC9010|nr:2-hydroxyacid dehydrogenase [Aliiglaciecola sp. CAU 1673]MDF2177586.1 2-hydroxyacid dehydrogenase [Aliiglaciecola sp. CAU 1673]